MMSKLRPNGFTLIEILVVVSIISLLLGLFMPALHTTRQQAQRIGCLNNLSQMAIAAHAYCSNFDEYYPIACYESVVNKVYTSVAWDFTSWKDWNEDEPETHVEPGLLWQGQTNIKVQQCPAFKGNANWLEDPYTGYNYNTSYIGSNDLFNPSTSARTTEVRSPSSTALFGDGEYTNGANKFMRAPFRNPREVRFGEGLRYMGVQGFRHLHTTNVAFCDGHAAFLREVHTETNETGQAALEEYNKTADVKIGFISADNNLYDLK